MDWIALSQFIFAFGTILLIRTVLKDRRILRGYDLFGSFLTLIAMSCVMIWFLEESNWIGFASGTISWIFWSFIVVFTARNAIKERRKKNRRINLVIPDKLDEWEERERGMDE